jgi:Kef-type K+ transport system membrane component KefB
MGDITGFVVNGFSDLINSFGSIGNLHGPEAIIFDIALILIISAIFAFIARILRQPLIPAYVLAGLLIGPLVFGLIKNVELIYALSEIGIAFLLFTAGLEISLRKIKQANLKKILIAGTLQVLLTFGITLLLAGLLNLETMQAVYIGIILSFGSTMVVIKLLSDKDEFVTLHGRLVLGILLLQDLVAIIAIVVLMSGGFALMPILIAMLKLVIIIAIAIFLQKFVLNKLFRFAARSIELLLLSALAVLFLFIILARMADISIVIGAFIAGVSLANSPFKVELESRISPLRDFFSILFFVALGMQIVFGGIAQHTSLLIFLIVAAFVLKPIITFLLLRISGYQSRTSFLSAVSLAQLSEFSLIIGALGLTLGAITPAIFSTVILATIVTMAITPYLVEYKGHLFWLLRKPLKLFNKLPSMENLEYKDKQEKSTILIGAHRMGSIILDGLVKRKKKELLVIDHDPEIVHCLVQKKISSIYGDITNPEIFESLDFTKLKTVISTVPDYESSLVLMRKIKARSKSVKVILTARRISEALDLYRSGADYVILPKVIAGKELLRVLGDGDATLSRERAIHIKKLKEIHSILY